jgi:hypothetical protein
MIYFFITSNLQYNFHRTKSETRKIISENEYMMKQETNNVLRMPQN